MVIETVIFTKCVIAVIKVYYSKQKATMIQHRKLKDFKNEAFINDLKALFAKAFHEEIVPFETLRKSLNVTLEKQASKKKTRNSSANQAPYMNKKLGKKIMKRSCRRKKLLNTGSDVDRTKYIWQRDHIVSLLTKEKKEFYGNRNTNILTDNMTIWRVLNPF